MIFGKARKSFRRLKKVLYLNASRSFIFKPSQNINRNLNQGPIFPACHAANPGNVSYQQLFKPAISFPLSGIPHVRTGFQKHRRRPSEGDCISAVAKQTTKKHANLVGRERLPLSVAETRSKAEERKQLSSWVRPRTKLRSYTSAFSLIGAGHTLKILEALTLLTLLAVTFWAVHPLLEEWSMFHAFNTYGLAYIQTVTHVLPLRPLHFISYGMQWLLGDGQPIGVAAGTSVLLLARYFVARWAVSPLLTGGYERWVVATLATALVSWPGVWLGRFSAAQLSAVFFFAALGFSVRLLQRWSMPFALGSAASVALLLSIYQALALCLIMIPLASLLWREIGDARQPTQKLLRIGFPLAIGFAVYGTYWLLISGFIGGGYEEELMRDSGKLLTAAGIWKHVKSAYVTAFWQNKLLLPFLLLMVFFLNQEVLGRLITGKARQLTPVLMVSLVVALLPVLSLIYISELHIRDVDRVLFPVSVGFALLCVSLLGQSRREYSSHMTLLRASVAVTVMVVSSSSLAVGIWMDGQYQKIVINKTLNALKNNDSQSVVIVDTTGVLGDVYTLLGTTLRDALAVYGRRVTATICTPLSVDRLHSVARRYPIKSTVRCEELSADFNNSLMLTARWENGIKNGKLTLDP